MATIGRVRVVWTGVAGAPYYSNFYFSGVTDPTSAQDAVDYVDTFLSGFSTSLASALIATGDPEVQLINDADGSLLGSEAVTPLSVTCSGGADILPRFTQGVIQWKTGVVVNGRLLRGRTYIPGFVEVSNVAGGVPLSTLVTSASALAQALSDEPSPPHLVVWSRTHGVSSPVLSGAMWNQWGTLRSRRD